MDGRTCETHNQWCPDGECPYCEPGLDIVLLPRRDVLMTDLARGVDFKSEPKGLEMITANINRETFNFWRHTPPARSPAETAKSIIKAMNEPWAKMVAHDSDEP